MLTFIRKIESCGAFLLLNPIVSVVTVSQTRQLLKSKIQYQHILIYVTYRH